MNEEGTPAGRKHLPVQEREDQHTRKEAPSEEKGISQCRKRKHHALGRKRPEVRNAFPSADAKMGRFGDAKMRRFAKHRSPRIFA